MIWIPKYNPDSEPKFHHIYSRKFHGIENYRKSIKCPSPKTNREKEEEEEEEGIEECRVTMLVSGKYQTS